MDKEYTKLNNRLNKIEKAYKENIKIYNRLSKMQQEHKKKFELIMPTSQEVWCDACHGSLQ